MLRERRRKGRRHTEEETIGILRRERTGIFALAGDDGYPCALPLGWIYADGKRSLYCAQTGRTMDAAAHRHKKLPSASAA